MSNAGRTFGRQSLQALNADAFLGLERESGKDASFAEIDPIVEHLLCRSFGEDQTVEFVDGVEGKNLRIVGLSESSNAIVERLFSLSHQQSNGAWYLPLEASFNTDWINRRWRSAHIDGFYSVEPPGSWGRVKFSENPGALLVWSILLPLLDRLALPLKLRSQTSRKQSREWQITAWQEIAAFLSALEFDLDPIVSQMRFGGGWSKLAVAEQSRIKRAYMQALVDQRTAPRAALVRAWYLRPLIARFYKLAGKETPKRQRVLTRELGKVLTGYFGGSWMAFLDYLGEHPNPDEKISTVLPEPKVFTLDRGRTAAIATSLGIPRDQAEQIVSAFWGVNESEGAPLEQRKRVLTAYWAELSEIYRRQVEGGTSLWGFEDERGFGAFSGDKHYRPGLSQTLLSKRLLAEVEGLWGTVVLPRDPTRLASAISPHSTVVDALGAAFAFWHDVSLTIWFVCEGPYSRTTIASMRAYHSANLRKLAALGTPADLAMFEDLQRAELRLGAPEPIYTHREDLETELGFTLRFSVSSGERRSGFGILRDIVGRYRAQWTDRYLESYLDSTSASDIRNAAHEFNLLTEQKGKLPSHRQFASRTASVCNRWFGGRLPDLYRAIGEKGSNDPVYNRLMPTDRYSFVAAVFARLHAISGINSGESSGMSALVNRERGNLEWCAEQALRFVQLHELLDRPPKLSEFGEGFQYRANAIAKDLQTAWDIYANIITDTLYAP